MRYVIITKAPIRFSYHFKTLDGWFAVCSLEAETSEKALRAVAGTHYWPTMGSPELDKTRAIPGDYIWAGGRVVGINHHIPA